MQLLKTDREPERSLLIQWVEQGCDAEQAERLAEELKHLAQSAGLLVSSRWLLPAASRIVATTFIGKGRVEEMAARCQNLQIDVVVFNNPLSPIQQRNLERLLEVKVVDRPGLILEIFAARARTREGRLQVALASLLYQQSRLVRSWTHLERQRGGVGLRGGPGESQIEIDRRLIRKKISKINHALKQVTKRRSLQRRVRREIPLYTIALVGYTNAGKSTLFNRLTQENVTVANQLFATLDPTLRRLVLPGGSEAVLSDTVGFIRDLPHDLIAAFRATLEEVCHADLLLLVVDASDPDREAHLQTVHSTLRELEAHHTPILTLYNKTDLIHSGENAYPVRPDTTAVSAQTGEGIPSLLKRLEREICRAWLPFQIVLPVTEGGLLARFYREGRVLDRSESEDHTHLHLTILLPTMVAARMQNLLKQYSTSSRIP